MAKWIDVKKSLPKHMQVVYVCCPTGQAVCVFIDTDLMNETLIKAGFKPKEDRITGKNDYAFCSQEIRGMTLNDVTHWMPLFPSPYTKH